MEKALIFLGKGGIGTDTESYQLLLRSNYYSHCYSGTGVDRPAFLEDASDEFAERIINEGVSLEVSLLNGFKIDESSNRLKRISRLGESIVGAFSRQITRKLSILSKRRAMAAIPVEQTN